MTKWWRTNAEYRAHQLRINIRETDAVIAKYQERLSNIQAIVADYMIDLAELGTALAQAQKSHEQEMIEKGLIPDAMIDPLMRTK
jgi:hypothetical protein